MNKIDKFGLNLKELKIQLLESLFPEMFLNGKLQLDLVKSNLLCTDDNEQYRFTWSDKGKSLRYAQMPSTGTLRLVDEPSCLTNNIYIEGDNLEVLKVMSKSYYNKIGFIYIDPPYNTGKDFVYLDDYTDNIKNYISITNQGSRANPETDGRYHTRWLNMMYPRLIVARNLLSSDGVIFVSIDETEVANLVKIMDEVFGEDNRLNTIVWNKRNAQNDETFIQKNHEYILVYKKGSPNLGILTNKDFKIFEDQLGIYTIGSGITTGGEGGTLKRRPNLGYSIYYNKETKDFFALDDYDHELCKVCDDEKKVYTDNINYLEKGYVIIRPPKKGEVLGCWTWSIDKFNNEKKSILIKENNNGNYSVFKKNYIVLDNLSSSKEISSKFTISSKIPPKSIIEISSGLGSKEVNGLLGHKVFENSKPVDLILSLMKMYDNKDMYVLDFFSGSATTAHAVMQLNAEDGGNRKFIMVQLPELTDVTSEAYKAGYKNICEIGKERIRRAGEQIKQDLIDKKNNAGFVDDNNVDPKNFDNGFKIFKLDSTNIIPWDGTIKFDEDTIFSQTEVIKADRTSLDVLYEIMLKYGVFDKPVEEIKVNGKIMYSIAKGYLIVCLDNNISLEDVKEIGKLTPRNVIFKESGFRNDNDKINATYTLEKLGVEEVKSI